jgi:hypothetical protein
MTRVLVLTGGLIHLVNQLAVAADLPETRGGGAEIGVRVTGALTWDPERLAEQHQVIETWLGRLRRLDPRRFGGLRLLPEAAEPETGAWDLACLNNLWHRSQREPLERLDIRDVIVCGDGLGIYYRSGRELRAILPSLLNRPIPEPGRRVRYALAGRQPRWHRPPGPVLPVPKALRQELFTALVESLEPQWSRIVGQCMVWGAPKDEGLPRPLWLCSVPNLAHQFPGRRIPVAVLNQWTRQLAGFDPTRDRLLLIDHPKAPPGGSFGAALPAATAGPIRSAVPVEVLVRALEREAPDRTLMVAGMTSALYGVRSLTAAQVRWLGLTPLWLGNPLYRRKPLEFLHRCLRVRRMAVLSAQVKGSTRLPRGLRGC